MVFRVNFGSFRDPVSITVIMDHTIKVKMRFVAYRYDMHCRCPRNYQARFHIFATELFVCTWLHCEQKHRVRTSTQCAVAADNFNGILWVVNWYHLDPDTPINTTSQNRSIPAPYTCIYVFGYASKVLDRKFVVRCTCETRVRFSNVLIDSKKKTRMHARRRERRSRGIFTLLIVYESVIDSVHDCESRLSRDPSIIANKMSVQTV